MWFNFFTCDQSNLNSTSSKSYKSTCWQRTKLWRIFLCFNNRASVNFIITGGGFDTHYQLMNIYGYYYIIPLITIFNFTGFWIPFDLARCQNSGHQIRIERNFENKLDVVHVRKMILIFGGLFLGIELLFLLNQFLLDHHPDWNLVIRLIDRRIYN